MPTLSLDPAPTRTRRLRGPSHASRLSSHRVRTPHSTSTSHTASATPAGPCEGSHCSLGRQGDRLRLHFRLQPRLQLLLGLLLRVRLRIGPRRDESETFTTKQLLSEPATGLVITSTPAGRFVYWPDRKPAHLIDGNSRCVAYLNSLPF
jgi:hypothetical protein